METKMTLGQIYFSLQSLNVNELTLLNHAVVDEIKHKQKQLARAFSVNERVEFKHSKTGITYQGTITKIGRVCVYLTTDRGTRWKVNPSSLQHVEKKVA
jgi:hypothetical protein